MTSLYRWAAVAAVALALALPGVARADGWTISSPLETTLNAGTDASSISRFYLTPEIGWQGQSLPQFHIGAASATSTQPFYSTGLTATGAQGGLTLGYLWPGNPLGGQNSRLELSTNVFRLSGGTSQSNASSLPDSQWLLVGGGAPQGTGGVNSTNITTKYTGGELAARAAADYPLTSTFTITPGLALFGGWSHLGIDYSDTEACDDGLCFVDTQNHTVRTATVGTAISVGSRLVISPAMSLLFGAGAALAYTDSELSSSDCFDENDTLPGCQSTDSTTSSSAKASHIGFGYRLMGQTGIRYVIGPAEINLLGGVRYGPTPTINNPTVAGQTVSLGSTQEFGYTVMLSVRIPFGGWPSRQ